MRPLTLELEGFTAFKQKTCIDFSTLDLFAITGPTGAGKSSLIDAMAYALYGRVPRISNEIGACLSQGMDRMYVQLVFRAGADTYRVFRETRRAGGSDARRLGSGNVRLERCRDGDWEPLEDRAGRANQRVEAVLGLDFDGFTRSIVLPQGQFQEFLAGAPDKRREVLRGLLRMDVYERVGVRARALGAQLGQRIGDMQLRLDEDFADAAPETVGLVQHQLHEAVSEIGALAGCVDRLARGTQLVGDVLSSDASLRAAVKEKEEAEISLTRTAALVAQAAEVIAEHQSRLTSIEERIARNPFDASLFAALSKAEVIARGLAETKARQHSVQTEITNLQAAEKQACAALEQAQKHGDLARARRESADEALQHAQLENAAAFVQARLSRGDDCPVCGGTVAELPHIACPDFQEARKAATAARDAEQTAQHAAARAEADLGAAAERAKAAQKRADELNTRVSELDRELQAALPDQAAVDLPAVRAGVETQSTAHVELQRLQGEERTARDELGKLQASLSEAREALSAYEANVARATAAASDAKNAAQAALEDLTALALQEGWGDTDKVATAEFAAQLEQQLTSARERVTGLQTAKGRLEQRVEQLQKQIAQREKLETEMTGVKKEHNVVADLAQMLRADRFQAFVQSEALQLLAEEGSRRLADLSAGRYQLTVANSGQDFEVIDQWNAEERRSVRTLSGGETFLASLALALALAETLPGLSSSPNMALDSIFLDEGFGSLDQEALDRAADALDSLRARDRMVCVVTHLRELAERLPARIVVHKSEAGSMVEVV